MPSKTLSVLAEGFVFLEGPRWRDDRLYVSDMWGHAIHTVTASGNTTKIADVPNRPSGLNFLPDGRLVAVSMADRKLVVVGGDGSLSDYADISQLAGGDINDSVVDAAGNIYVGNFGYDLFSGEEAKLASMVRVAPDGTVAVVAEELNFPNGAVITDTGTMICAETFASQLTAFDLGPDGSLTNRRVWASLGDHTPDGICLDQEGAIWVSSFGAGEFLRVTEGGKIVETIAADDGKRAVACNLGGADGRTLFALTFEGEIEDISAGGKKARIEVCTVDVPGAGSP